MKTDRGPNDLEETIERLKKQVTFLQHKCRQAGQQRKQLEKELEDVRKTFAGISEPIYGRQKR